MPAVEMTEVRSRLGSFAVIKIGQMVLISPCDTRMRILEALSKRSLTGDELARKTSVSYSCIMDHMEFLEKLGIVKVSLQKTEEGRRRIHFHFSEDPLEGIQELFMASTKRNGSRRRNEVVAVL